MPVGEMYSCTLFDSVMLPAASTLTVTLAEYSASPSDTVRDSEVDALSAGW